MGCDTLRVVHFNVPTFVVRCYAATEMITHRLFAPLQLAAVQFHLINTVILFLSREGFRRGCLRTPVVRGIATRHLCFG